MYLRTVPFLALALVFDLVFALVFVLCTDLTCTIHHTVHVRGWGLGANRDSTFAVCALYFPGVEWRQRNLIVASLVASSVVGIGSAVVAIDRRSVLVWCYLWLSEV